MVAVECYSGARYAERPVALTWCGERLSVESIERSWRTPDSLTFIVRIGDGRRFELTCQLFDDRWGARPLED
jgi:hypothetical protein